MQTALFQHFFDSNLRKLVYRHFYTNYICFYYLTDRTKKSIGLFCFRAVPILRCSLLIYLKKESEDQNEKMYRLKFSKRGCKVSFVYRCSQSWKLSVFGKTPIYGFCLCSHSKKSGEGYGKQGNKYSRKRKLLWKLRGAVDIKVGIKEFHPFKLLNVAVQQLWIKVSNTLIFIPKVSRIESSNHNWIPLS